MNTTLFTSDVNFEVQVREQDDFAVLDFIKFGDGEILNNVVMYISLDTLQALRDEVRSSPTVVIS